MIRNVLTAIAILLHSAFAQNGVGTGTIIIFNSTEDKLIVAADSRLQPFVSSTPDDTYCKVATLGHQIVFTSVGTPGASGALNWTNVDVASSLMRSARLNGLDFRLHDLVVAWGNSIMHSWRAAYLISPATVIAAAERNDGHQITSGIFARTENGKFYWEGAAITFDRSKLEPIDFIVGQLSTCWACGQQGSAKICAAGKVDVAKDFCTERHPDVSASRSLTDRIGEEGVLAIRVADFTVTYDHSGEIGGPIDAVELNRDGRIRWLARKDNCPENQD